MIALLSSSVADAILLWRCYTVWGKRRRVIVLPAIFYIAAHTVCLVVGFVFTSSDVEGFGQVLEYEKIVNHSYTIAAISAGVVGLNNLLLSSLIAFRIFRMSREVVAYLGARPKSMYRTIIAVTLESGLLYSAFLNVLFIIGMVSTFSTDTNFASAIVLPICLRIWAPIAGLVSTTIIIRVALGIDNDMENTIIPFRATHVENEDAAVIDISQSFTDLEQKGTSERLNALEPKFDESSRTSGNTNIVN
ncbi:hypothetical protein MPER_05207 [Moniliophthora perniciosa FA553]|nr:hypothetical protein MPER_05207 [Moniliophthora perniciosa FA553]